VAHGRNTVWMDCTRSAVQGERERGRENGKERKRVGLLLSSLDQYILPATTQPTLYVSTPRHNPRPLCGAHPPTSPHFERTATTAFARTRTCMHTHIHAVHRVGDTVAIYMVSTKPPSFAPSFRVDWSRSTLSTRLTSNRRAYYVGDHF